MPPLNLDFKTVFPYQLDDFQVEAIALLDAGKSVLVTAPTGSGKTLIGEYAIYRALNSGQRVFYTTPLKALSNQKFRDFQEKFGQTLVPESGLYAEIGLITGDVSINPEAPIVVMTTEIFRNMLYSTPIGEVGTSVRNVQSVVLDECHYINDPGRGTVWEESIIYCPPHIQLVALSATVGNPQQLCDWVNYVRRCHFQQGNFSRCELVNSDFRPVPLKFYFSHSKGLQNLFKDKSDKINPQLKSLLRPNKRGRFDRKTCPTVKGLTQQLNNQNMLPAIYIIFSRKGCDQAVESLNYVNLVSVDESKKILSYLLRFLLLESIELQDKIVEFARKEHEITYDKIISFITKKEGGEVELIEFLTEKPLLKERILRFLGDNSELVRSSQIEPLTRGIAAHHAGILPAWKELVERLFEKGLIKIVFATATLAAGINMPARTTVISALRKRGDDGIRTLTPSEFLQIAGRAGRRGMDEVGYVVTVQTPYEGVLIASKLAKAEPEALRSWFTPSYGMVLNLLQKHSIEEAKQLLELSFAEYLAQVQLNPQEEAIASYTREITRLDVGLAGYNSKDLSAYEKLKERLKQEKKILKLFHKNWRQQRVEALKPSIANLIPGNILSLNRQGKKNAYVAEGVMIAKISNNNQEFFLCLGKDNHWYIASISDIIDINSGKMPLNLVENLYLPEIENICAGQLCAGDATSQAITDLISEHEKEYTPVNEEILAQEKRIEAVENLVKQHPLDKVEKIGQLMRNNSKRQTLKQELTTIQNQYQKVKSHSSYYWQEFLALVEILREFGALKQFEPTILGEAAAVIRGENELWLALALTSGHLDFLPPHYLAPAITALITDPPRFDTWVAYQPSVQVLDALGLVKIDDEYNPEEQLTETRRKLYQAQTKKDITMPVYLERDVIGLSEAWCMGVTWDELCSNTTLDEGDIVRILRRTVDVLWQIPQVPGVNAQLADTARDAFAKMKRFPI
ncbi:DEAD/DEAH box helicase [Cyanobacterium sp. IPPAS B-1200]|uniref:DEAD/DEAH box helicase n=1 Tax=Cyanobacterium sp. IPPAS B-1200 TaxID=1562720 RepID=UPI000852486B|nr:DEAD/DEAH box helicase [Cyanobacterium sp. IPPAS B-1200]OEJ78938.1 DEAD/DEAH box helicase [Cyanobacterium sp. IPPAS B-1200]